MVMGIEFFIIFNERGIINIILYRQLRSYTYYYKAEMGGWLSVAGGGGEQLGETANSFWKGNLRERNLSVV